MQALRETGGCCRGMPALGAPGDDTAGFMTVQRREFDYIRSGVVPPAPDGTVSAFVGFWRQEAARAGQPMPRKSDFTIKRLKPFLATYYVAEWTGDDLVNRLVGSELDRQLGETLTGCSFLARYSGDQRSYFETFWPLVLQQPCGVISARTRHRGDGNAQRIEGVALPLADASGTPRFLCGVGAVSNLFEARAATGIASVTIDYVRFLDLGAGTPADPPDPAVFNQSVVGQV